MAIVINLSQVNLQAAKTNYERELTQKEEAAEEARRGLIKQLRELEQSLEDERKQRSVAQSEKKKVESELAEVEAQIDAEARGREDAQKMYKKAHVSMHTHTRTHTHTHTHYSLLSSLNNCHYFYCVLAFIESVQGFPAEGG